MQFCPLILFRSEKEPRLLIFTGDQTKLSGNLRPSTWCVPLLFPNPLSRMSNLCTAFALIFYVPPLRSLKLTISMLRRITKKPLRPWRWSHLISLAQHIVQQCDLRRAINIQDSLKYLVAWCGNMPLHFLGDIPMSTRTSDSGPEYPNQNLGSDDIIELNREKIKLWGEEINQEHRGHMYPFWSRGSVMGLPMKAICEPNELFHLTLTFRKHQKRMLTNTIMVNTFEQDYIGKWLIRMQAKGIFRVQFL